MVKDLETIEYVTLQAAFVRRLDGWTLLVC